MLKTNVYRVENGEWVEIQKCFYPVNINEVLDQSLDTGIVTFDSDNPDLLPPMTQIKIVEQDINDSTSVVTFERPFYFYGNDNATCLSEIIPFYEHRLRLIEPSKRLQMEMTSGMSVTQPITGAKRTLFEVTTKLLSNNPLRKSGAAQLYTLTTDSYVLARLNVESPEFKWSNKTSLWECLQSIGSFVGAIPRLIPNPTDDTKYDTVTFDFLDQVRQNLSELNAIGRSTTFEEEQYCSQIETFAENLMVSGDENQASITEPSENGWINTRTEEFRLTKGNTSNFIPTQFPIYKIVKLTLKALKIRHLLYIEGSGEVETVETVQNLNITPNVVEYPLFNTLQHHPLDSSLGKWSALYYNIGEKNIYNGNYKGSDYVASVVAGMDAVSRLGKFRYAVAEPPYPTADDLEFRIEYIPLVPGKIRTVKNTKQPMELTIPYNQQAEIYDAKSLGQDMWKRVQAFGNLTQTVLRTYDRFSDIPQIGDKFGDFLIVNVETEISSVVTVSAVLTLSQDYNLISRYIELNTKYRQWAIPNDGGYIDRNIFWQEYISIDEEFDAKALDVKVFGFMRIFMNVFGKKPLTDVPHTEQNCCQLLYDWKSGRDDYGYGVLLPCHASALANSLRFNVRTKDNVSAGSFRSGSGSDIEVREAFYTRKLDGDRTDGIIDKIRIVLGAEIAANNPSQLPNSIQDAALPSINCNYLVNPTFDTAFDIYKDANEWLNFTYQVHVVSTIPGILIGELLTQHSPLIKTKTETTFKTWKLNEPLSFYTQKINDSAEEINLVFSAAFTGDTMNFRLELFDLPEAEGWAITDENGNLYIAENTKIGGNRTLYFNFKTNR